jgi:hypothetical protein
MNSITQRMHRNWKLQRIAYIVKDRIHKWVVVFRTHTHPNAASMTSAPIT